VIRQLGAAFIVAQAPRLHAHYSGAAGAREQARLAFCGQLAHDEWPFAAHLHPVRQSAHDSFASLRLAVAPRGLLLFAARGHGPRHLALSASFAWHNVAKISAHVSARHAPLCFCAYVTMRDMRV
jgi:hypothetical protein